ncbi:MAG: hypothetical protein JXQ76_08805 [Campylobacterales bacterium]|nr:hypothetical protein [Campylobacterales bacterium]
MISHLQQYIDTNIGREQHKIYGVVTAIVTKNKDPNGLGRIKVKFPWMSESKNQESNWVRIATLMAGNKRGTYFIPEIDDEVLIAFENGDVDAPYMIGAIWNGKDKPTENNDNDKNDIRSITSRSGHKIILDDTKNTEVVTIIDKTKKMKLVFKVKDKAVELFNETAQGTMKIYSKGKMTIQSDDDIDIISKKNINIKATQDINVDANNINTKSKANTKIDAGAKADILSKAPMKLDSKATMDLKASAPVKMEGATVGIKATGPAKLEGAIVELKASGMGKFQASGMLDLQSSGIASLKGSLTKLG